VVFDKSGMNQKEDRVEKKIMLRQIIDIPRKIFGGPKIAKRRSG
jgi:hypothetical protein